MRVIASLFHEDVHLVVAAKSKIKSVADLRGKRVSLGSDGSGVGITVREILAAYGVPETSLKLVHGDGANDAALLQAGKLDAFFAVGGVPLDPVTRSVHAAAWRGWCRSTGRPRPAGQDGAVLRARRHSGQCLSGPGGHSDRGDARLVDRARQRARRLVYGITRALFNPPTTQALAASHPSAREIGLADAARQSAGAAASGRGALLSDRRIAESGRSPVRRTSFCARLPASSASPASAHMRSI